jgi:deoxyadenosine/deoxycytidine kinase
MRLQKKRTGLHNDPHIIELAGVAGAGKSSLLRAMKQRNTNIRSFPAPSKINYLPSLLKVFITWLPFYLGKYRNSRWFTRQEIRNMGYLDTWLSFIRKMDRTRQNFYVLDPGSAYWLSSLQAYGPTITKHPYYQSWWKKKFDQWSSGLNAIIWLDAPGDICLQRVLSRNEWHPIKEMPLDSAISEVNGYRDCYEHIVPQMASSHGIKLFHFHTDQISTEKMIDQIFSDTDLWGE